MALLFCLGDFLRLRAAACFTPSKSFHVGISIVFDGIYPGIFRPHVRVSVEIPAKWNNFSTQELGTNPTETKISSVAGNNYHAF